MRAKEAVRVKETRNESERAAIPKPSHTLRGGRERERETEREREFNPAQGLVNSSFDELAVFKLHGSKPKAHAPVCNTTCLRLKAIQAQNQSRQT